LKYIILLRGINISGKNKVAMPVLKTALEESGFKNVFTYLNSGNVVLESDVVDKQVLGSKICEIIKEKFKIEVPVFVSTPVEINDILKNSPNWWDTNDKNIYNNLIFIIPPTTYKEVFATVGEPSPNIDSVKEYNNYIFWSFDLKNYRKSNWWVKTASTNIKDKITIRTANTIKRVLELCNK